jgi:hypothetical protein
MRFEEANGRHVAIIDVDPSPGPVYSKTEHGDAFFCRLASTTRSLSIAEVQSYVEQHWTG